MTHSRSLLPILALAIVSISACEDTPTNPGDNRSLLTARPWKTTSYTVDGADLTSLAQVRTVFKTDGTYTATNPDGSTESGTWAFNVDETSIAMTEGATTTDWSIMTLTSTSMRLRAALAGSVADWQGIPD